MTATALDSIQVLWVESVESARGWAGPALEAESAFKLVHAASLEGALAELRAQRFEVVLLDLFLPDSQGISTFTRVQTEAGSVPIVVLSTLEQEATARAALAQGAQDYVLAGEAGRHQLAHLVRFAIQRKRAAEELAQREQFFRLISENVQDLIAVVDRDGRRLYNSPSYRTLLGDPDNKRGTDSFEEVHPEDRSRVRRAFDATLATGDGQRMEYRFLLPDGSCREVESLGSVIHDAEGKPVKVVVISRDITERKRLETDQRQFFNLSPDLFCIAGFDGRFKQLNPAWEKKLGLTAEELVSRPYLEFVHPDDREATRTQAERLRQGREIVCFENRYLCRDGTFRWFAWNARSWPEQAAIYAVARDITEHKQAEERLQNACAELARSEDSLRRVVADLNRSHAELHTTQIRLIQAAKMESVGTLAAGVAHEVKNPLQILLWGVRYLADQLPADHDTAYTLQSKLVLQDMRNAVTRADTIVRGLLDYSASHQLELKEDDLNDILDESLRLVNYELTRHQVSVSKHLEPGVPRLPLDRVKMEQVFVNVFMNAVQAMPRGGTLTVRTRCLPGTGDADGTGSTKDGTIQVEIEDTGTGIPADAVGRVFEPFFTTKPSGKGTGLGLTVVKNIIAMHGGEIEINNLLEGGVRVTLWLKPAVLDPGLPDGRRTL